MLYHHSVVFLVLMYRLGGVCIKRSEFVQPQLIIPDDSLEWFYPLHTQQPCLGLPFAPIQVVPTPLHGQLSKLYLLNVLRYLFMILICIFLVSSEMNLPQEGASFVRFLVQFPCPFSVEFQSFFPFLIEILMNKIHLDSLSINMYESQDSWSQERKEEVCTHQYLFSCSTFAPWNLASYDYFQQHRSGIFFFRSKAVGSLTR